jgi:hypothetical protein
MADPSYPPKAETRSEVKEKETSLLDEFCVMHIFEQTRAFFELQYTDSKSIEKLSP